jgi:hypothetical protein
MGNQDFRFAFRLKDGRTFDSAYHLVGAEYQTNADFNRIKPDVTRVEIASSGTRLRGICLSDGTNYKLKIGKMKSSRDTYQTYFHEFG